VESPPGGQVAVAVHYATSGPPFQAAFFSSALLHLILYYGVLAPRAAWQAALVR
jgi:hypothetical protein